MFEQSVTVYRSVHAIRQHLADAMDIAGHLSPSGVQIEERSGERFLEWLTPNGGMCRLPFRKLSPERTELGEPFSTHHQPGDDQHLRDMWDIVLDLAVARAEDDVLQKVAEGWAAGKSQREVAMELAASPRQVRRWFNELKGLGRVPQDKKWTDQPN